MSIFGTMEDFDLLLEEIHKRDMRLIMDLVVNHTSDEHPWFQEAVHNPDSPYKDYYITVAGSPDTPPNNWSSVFGGLAWNYYEDTGLWALHLFSSKQMDLNWDNKNVRSAVIDMVRWWLDKGVDGFRLDVINFISKADGLPDGNKQIGDLIGYRGAEHYFHGPRLHAYLQELQKKAFTPYDAFSVGETPGFGMELSKLMSSDEHGELDMVFSFDHLDMPGHLRFDIYKYDLNYLKEYYIDWMTNYDDHCWMPIFFDNHDNPRMISKVNSEPRYKKAVATLLATLQMTLKGTPFIYQGEEIAMENIPFKSIDEIEDVESINMYKEYLKTMSEEEAFSKILAGTRDHARAMLNWDDIHKQVQTPNSVFNYYKRLIYLRKKYKALVYGRIKIHYLNKKNIFAFSRSLGGNRFYIECNLSPKKIKRPPIPYGCKQIISNYKVCDRYYQPYQAIIWKICRNTDTIKSTISSDRKLQ